MNVQRLCSMKTELSRTYILIQTRCSALGTFCHNTTVRHTNKEGPKQLLAKLTRVASMTSPAACEISH